MILGQCTTICTSNGNTRKQIFARRALERQSADFLSDIQAPQKPLAFHQVTSKLAWDNLENQRILAKHNKVGVGARA